MGEWLTVEQRRARGESMQEIVDDITAEAVAILDANLVEPVGSLWWRSYIEERGG